MPLKNSDKRELENFLKLDGSHKMVRSLKKNCNRRIVLTDKPFYVTEAVNEDLKNYVSLKVSLSHGCCSVSYTHLTLPTNREV